MNYLKDRGISRGDGIFKSRARTQVPCFQHKNAQIAHSSQRIQKHKVFVTPTNKIHKYKGLVKLYY